MFCTVRRMLEELSQLVDFGSGAPVCSFIFARVHNSGSAAGAFRVARRKLIRNPHVQRTLSHPVRGKQIRRKAGFPGSSSLAMIRFP
jgi:hypothetical protein